MLRRCRPQQSRAAGKRTAARGHLALEARVEMARLMLPTAPDILPPPEPPDAPLAACGPPVPSLPPPAPLAASALAPRDDAAPAAAAPDKDVAPRLPSEAPRLERVLAREAARSSVLRPARSLSKRRSDPPAPSRSCLSSPSNRASSSSNVAIPCRLPKAPTLLHSHCRAGGLGPHDEAQGMSKACGR